MINSYANLRVFVDGHLATILAPLGKTFDSNQFVESFHRTYPCEYAAAMRFAGTYGNLNTWFARWYLKECGSVRDMGLDSKARPSANDNPTHNHRWEKL